MTTPTNVTICPNFASQARFSTNRLDDGIHHAETIGRPILSDKYIALLLPDGRDFMSSMNSSFDEAGLLWQTFDVFWDLQTLVGILRETGRLRVRNTEVQEWKASHRDDIRIPCVLDRNE